MLAGAVVAGVAGGIALMSMPSRSEDSIRLPPAAETFAAPSGAYVLEIAMNGAPRDWMREGATATLTRRAAAGDETRWRRRLPHNYRPRTAFVTDSGRVVLLDQWINVLGPLAVTVLAPDGGAVATHDFAAVAAAVDLPPAEIAARAEFGPWMSARPAFDPTSGTVRVAVAGRTLVISPEDGGLSRLP